MCRIAGIITTQPHNSKNHFEDVKAMCTSMKNGGPDGFGIYQTPDKKVTLGNRRLSLIDLSENGHQPMEYSDGTTITYNGEIYNHLEIKKELLSLNYRFNTESDTEVLLVAYKCWGTNAFKKLKGMYSFCLYDPHLEEIFLVRSPLGIKPLYYSLIDDKLIFASEVKAFTKCGEQFQPLSNWKIYFLAFGHIPEPYTTLEHVKSLPKGHYLKKNLTDGNSEIVEYFSFNYEETIADRNEAKKKIKETLKKAVKSHLISDAPIGIFLSGGIDSSILTLIADDCTRQLQTISVNFKEVPFSEEKYQEIIADKTISKHVNYTLNQTEFDSNLSEALQAMDQPSNDGINTWFISKIAKENGLKAVISGIGADEYLGGYASFRRGNILNLLNILPVKLLKIISRLPFTGTRRSYYLSYNSPVGEYLFLRGLYDPKRISKILKLPVSTVNETLNGLNVQIPESVIKDKKSKISWLEANMYLQNQLLKDSDCMSMYHGIELRTPYLDEDFVQTCLNIKSSIRFDRRQKKQLLVDAFQDILPPEIYSRRKMGFTLPFTKWLKNNILINTKSTYKSNAYILKLLVAFKNDKLSWAKVLALYQIKTFTPHHLNSIEQNP